MITALAFIITFIVVGLVRRRRRVQRRAAPERASAGPDAPEPPVRRLRRHGLVVVLLGVLVPALVIAVGEGQQERARVACTLTASEASRARGLRPALRDLPHAEGARTPSGKVGPNLDQLVGGSIPRARSAFILTRSSRVARRAAARCPRGSSTARTRRTSRRSSRPSPVTESRAGSRSAGRSAPRRSPLPASRCARRASDARASAPRPAAEFPRSAAGEATTRERFAGLSVGTTSSVPDVKAVLAPSDCGGPGPSLRCPPSELLSSRLVGAWPRGREAGDPSSGRIASSCVARLFQREPVS